MGSRRDYYRDPDAPRPNSLKPGASVLVTDEDGRVLMQRRGDSGNWSLPGGIMETGETLGECAVRETKEETGLDIEVTGLLGIYTDPEHVIAYEDGEVRQQFAVVYYGRVIGGEVSVSYESTEVRFIDLVDLEALPVHETVRLRLRHHAERRRRPIWGEPSSYSKYSRSFGRRPNPGTQSVSTLTASTYRRSACSCTKMSAAVTQAT